jgi:hypothetical protein
VFFFIIIITHDGEHATNALQLGVYKRPEVYIAVLFNTTRLTQPQIRLCERLHKEKLGICFPTYLEREPCSVRL